MSFQSFIPLPVGMMVAMVLSLSLPKPGKTAETIVVRYKSDTVTVTRQDLDTFVARGNLSPALRKLVGADPQKSRAVRTLLGEELLLTRSAERFFRGDNGDFISLKLDQAIRGASGSTQENLQGMRTALQASFADRRVSFMEIIARHPQSHIQVDLTQLEDTYQGLQIAAERVLPALELAKDLLQDFLRDDDADDPYTP